MNVIEVSSRARSIQLAVFDVDGVLTDGRLYLAPDGREVVKVFHTLDGHGLKMLKRAGIGLAIISGRRSEAVVARAQSLGFDHVYQEVEDKRTCFTQLLKERSQFAIEAFVMGDDLPDLPMMLDAGLSAAPANAHRDVIARATLTTHAKGGEGAAREACDWLLDLRGSLSADRFLA